MRLIDADKLPYEDIESTDGRTYMCVNAYDIDHASTIEVCEDCISRKELLSKIEESPAIPGETWDDLYDFIIKEIKALPSVKPEPEILTCSAI